MDVFFEDDVVGDQRIFELQSIFKVETSWHVEIKLYIQMVTGTAN